MNSKRHPWQWFRAPGLKLTPALLPFNILLAVLVFRQPVVSAQFLYQKVLSLGYATDSGNSPFSSLLEGSDGFLYGTTYGGGASNMGTIFRLNSDGGGYQILYSFRGSPGDGAEPYAALGLGTNGALYGTTEFGGSNNIGTIF